jgi:PAS domain S-box-containing protein
VSPIGDVFTFRAGVWGKEPSMSPESSGTGTPPVEAGQDPRKTLEELRAILYSIGDGVIVADPACRITRMNPVASSLTGWSEAEALGKHLDEVFRITGEHAEVPVERVANRILREGKTVGLSNNTLLIARDGTARPIADCGSPVFDPQGFIVGMVLVFRDQSAQRAAQQALQKSEERHRTVADLTNDWEYWQAPDGEMLYMSPSCQRITGYRRDEFIARPGLMEEILHPDDRPIWDRQQAGEGEIEQELEFRIVRRDGELRWIGCIRQPARRADGTSLGLRVSNRDITARKRAEQALHEERRLFIGGPTVVFKWRAAAGWPVEYVSPNVLAQLGHPAEALTSGTLPYSELVHPEDLARVAQEVEGHTLAGAPVFEQEYRLRHADGEYRWIYDFTTVIRDDLGVVTHYHGYIQDITRRKQTDEQSRLAHVSLERAVRFTEALLSAIPTPVFYKDTEGRYLGCNRAFTEIMGVSSEQIVGKTTFELWPSEHAEMYHRMDLQLMENPERQVYEFKVRDQHGAERLVIYAKDVFRDENERVSGIVGAFMDITERKRAEEAFRAANERFASVLRAATAYAITATDPEGVIKVVNGGAELMLGYPAEELVDRTTPLIFHDWNEVTARAKELGIEPGFGVFTQKAIQGAPDTREWTYVHRDGKRLTVSLTIGAMRNADGTLAGFVGIARDITVEKQLQRQILQSQRMESVGLLAGGVAHDFNNLLTPIMGYADMVQSWLPEDDPLREPVAEIGRAAGLAKELTQRLLAFSRRQVIALQTVDLGDIIRRFRAMLRRIIRENVAIEVDLPAASIPVCADAGQLEQVLVNLAINAQDAMPMGGVLTIETKDVDLDETYTARHLEVAPGPYVMLAVSDTGVGMDEATMARIFEPFFTTKEAGKGTGLGLSTVYGIVKQHSGSISVYSEKGHGSTFKIFLPRVLEAGAPRPGPRADVVLRGTETVLVVEDNETVRALVGKMLHGLGYEVLTTQGVEPCVALAEKRQGSLHLLLTDVVMPGMNGRELYERLRRLRPELKVLFMSGYTTNVIGHHGVLDQGVYLLQKPFTLSALSIKVREVLDS